LTRADIFTARLGILPTLPWPTPSAGAHPAIQAWHSAELRRGSFVVGASSWELRRGSFVVAASFQLAVFTARLGILPTLPWPTPSAGVHPAIQAWHSVELRRGGEFSTCNLHGRDRPKLEELLDFRCPGKSVRRRDREKAAATRPLPFRPGVP
jgi:hypothetical protein